MANVEFTRAAAATPLSGLFATIANRFAKRREFNKTVRELSELDNRTLADLGISRAQIRSIAYETVYLHG